MANDKKGLGKGLRALFDNVDTLSNISKTKSLSTHEMSIESIIPNESQPRKYFEQSMIDELSESIKALGLIQPITVREDGKGNFVIISGERRFRACVQAGLKTVPVYERKVNDTEMLEMALVENVQREDLSAIEVAETLKRLIEECSITQDNLSQRIGKKRSTISNYIRLLKLPVEVQLALQRNLLSMGHARALLSLSDSKNIIDIADKIVEEGLSVRQVEQLVKNIVSKPTKKEKAKVAEPEYFPILATKMKTFMSQDVDIRRVGKGKTRITIDVNNDDDMMKLLEKFDNIY